MRVCRPDKASIVNKQTTCVNSVCRCGLSAIILNQRVAFKAHVWATDEMRPKFLGFISGVGVAKTKAVTQQSWMD